MGSADHTVIAEESGDLFDRVVKAIAGLDRHAVAADLECKGDRTDDRIGTQQRTFPAQMQVGWQGWRIGD